MLGIYTAFPWNVPSPQHSPPLFANHVQFSTEFHHQMKNKVETWGSILSNILSRHLALSQAGKKVDISGIALHITLCKALYF